MAINDLLWRKADIPPTPPQLRHIIALKNGARYARDSNIKVFAHAHVALFSARYQRNPLRR
jgi:hypothetical protein